MKALQPLLDLLKLWQLNYTFEEYESSSVLLIRDCEPLTVRVRHIQPDSFHFEAIIVQDVKRNRLSLWNSNHYNRLQFPVGQLYISKQNHLCLGFCCRLDKETNMWLSSLLAHLLSTSLGWHQALNRDFADLPFKASEYEAESNTLLAFHPPYHSPFRFVDLTTASYLIERLMNERPDLPRCQHINDQEFALSDEFVTLLNILPTKSHRFPDATSTWYLGLKTELGYLSHLDVEACIRFNEHNSQGKAFAITLTYSKRKHLLSITSGLVSEYLQHPAMLALRIKEHQEAATRWHLSLKADYNLTSVAGFHLGF